MKKIYSIMAFAAALCSLCSCEGNVDNEESGEGLYNEEYATGVYTLVADKTTIEANGADAVTFTLYGPDGENLTAGAQRNYITIQNETEGKALTGLTFTSTLDGEYTFYAYYRNYESDNKVTIKVQNRAKYEKYYKKVAIYDLTSAYCGPCAQLAASFETMDKEWADRMVMLGIHGSYKGDHDLWSENTENAVAALMREYGNGGYPCIIFNLDEVQIGYGITSLQDAVAEIQSQISKYPAYCGIKIDTEYSADNNTYSVNAELTASSAGEFDLGCALLLDGQTMSGGEASIYNDIVRNISRNYMSMSVSKKTLSVDEKMTYSLVNQPLPDPSDYAENYRVVVFALRNAGNKVIIDNIAECPLGGSVDYKYNE